MRVYSPRKDMALLGEAIKALYLLKQAIDYQSGTVDSRLNMVDDVRFKVQSALDILEEKEKK
jgi:hypothetical protein